HVERPVLAEREAALGHVELRRGHAEVELHPVQAGRGRVPAGEVGEAAAEDRDARIAAELALGEGDGFGILVHQQQSPPRAQLAQHAARMAAAPERAIQVRSIRLHREAFHDLVEEHRKVAWTGRIPGATRRHSCRSSSPSPRSASLSVCRICARCACSLHSSNLSPMPSSTAFFSSPLAWRCEAGIEMRPLPSGSTNAAAPTSFNCICRLTWRVRGNALTWSRTFSQVASGYRYRQPDSNGL